MSEFSITQENLADKVILEVGSGRGDTTRQLVALLTAHPGARLIVTDISDYFFPRLREEFKDSGVPVEFRCTAAQDLSGIADGSVDHLVCHYTLCGVNAHAGMATVALQRFQAVLKPGGRLWVEEEFPIAKPRNPAQEVWAEKWCILKSALILAGRLPYIEIAPENLTVLCRLAGFTDIRWSAHTEFYPDPGALDFFQQRLDALLTELEDENICAGFLTLAQKLHLKAAQVGGMEVPYYKLTACKPPAAPANLPERE